jgi:regulator of replication initiation timing
MKGKLIKKTRGICLIIMTIVSSHIYGETSSIDEPEACKDNAANILQEISKSIGLFTPITEKIPDEDKLKNRENCENYFKQEFPLNKSKMASSEEKPCECLLQENFKVKNQDLKPLVDRYHSDEVLKLKASNYGKDIGVGLNTLREILTSDDKDLFNFLKEGKDEKQGDNKDQHKSPTNYELAVQCLGTIEENKGCEDKEKEKMIGRASLERILGIMDRKDDIDSFQVELGKKISMNGSEADASLTGHIASLVLIDPNLKSPESDNNLKVLFERTIKEMVNISPYLKKELHPRSRREELLKASQLILEQMSSVKEGRVGPTTDNAKMLIAREELAAIVASSYVWAGNAKHLVENEEDFSKIYQDYQSTLLTKNRYKGKNQNLQDLLTQMEKENIQKSLWSCANAAKKLAGLCSKNKIDESDVSSFRYLLKVEDKTRDSLEIQAINLQESIANEIIGKDPIKSKQLHAVACYLKGNMGNQAYKNLLSEDASNWLKAENKVDIQSIAPVAEPVSEGADELRQRCTEIIAQKGGSLMNFTVNPIHGLGTFMDDPATKECIELYGNLFPEVKVKKAEQLSTINDEIPKAQVVAKKDSYRLKSALFRAPETKSFLEKIEKGDYVSARNSVVGLGEEFRLTKEDYQAPSLAPDKKVINAVSQNGGNKDDGPTINYSSSLLDLNDKSAYNPKKFLVENKAALNSVSPQNVQKLEEVIEEREETVKKVEATVKEIEKIKVDNPADQSKLKELEDRLDNLSTSLTDRDQQIAKLVEENRKLGEELAKTKIPLEAPVANAASSASSKKINFKPKANTSNAETKIIKVLEPIKEVGKTDEDKRTTQENLGLAQSTSSSYVFRGPSSIAQMSIPTKESAEFKEFAQEAFKVGYEYEAGKVFIYDEEGHLKILELVDGQYELRDAPYTINPKSEIHLMDQEDFLESSLGDEVIDSTGNGPIRYPEIPSIMDQYFNKK